MTRIGTGVVYGDDEGRVVYAADDGSREVLGHKDPDVPVAATDETGWAAWVDTGGDRAEAGGQGGRHRQRGRRRPAVGRPMRRSVAVDGDTVYYARRRGRARAAPGRGPEVQPVSPHGLLDVRSRIRAFQVDEDTIEVVQSFFNASYQVPGQGAELSPDGNLVATRLPGTGPGRASTTPAPARRSRTAYPTATTWSTLAPGSTAHRDLRRRARRARHPGSELELRTCDLDHSRSARSPPGSPTGAARRCWHAERHGRPCTSSARSTSSAPARSPATRSRSSTTPTTSTTHGCSCSRSGPTCPRRRSCCAPPAPRPTTGCGSSPPAASCRSPATRRSAARTRGSRPGGTPRGEAVVQECGAGLVTIERGDRLAFQAPPLLRDGPVDEERPRHDHRRPRHQPRRRRRHQVGRQRPGLGRRAPRRRARRAGPAPGPRAARRAGTSASSGRGATAASDADVEVRAFDRVHRGPGHRQPQRQPRPVAGRHRAARAVRRGAGHRDRPPRPGAREAGGEHGVGGRRHPHDAPWRGQI